MTVKDTRNINPKELLTSADVLEHMFLRLMPKDCEAERKWEGLPIQLFYKGDGFAFTVTRNAIEFLEGDFDSVYAKAYANTENESRMVPMDNMFGNLMGGDYEVPMAVLTNVSAYHGNPWFGASAVLSTKLLLETAAYLKSDEIYLLPSSKHEMLAVPTKATKLCELVRMVKEINATAVAKADYLTDDVFWFDSKTCEVRRCIA